MLVTQCEIEHAIPNGRRVAVDLIPKELAREGQRFRYNRRGFAGVTWTVKRAYWTAELEAVMFPRMDRLPYKFDTIGD